MDFIDFLIRPDPIILIGSMVVALAGVYGFMIHYELYNRNKQVGADSSLFPVAMYFVLGLIGFIIFVAQFSGILELFSFF